VTIRLTKARAWRRFLRSALLRQIACWVTHCYIRFVYLTNRWTVEGSDWTRRLTREGRSFICVFWHGRLLMMPLAWHRMTSFHMLISAHRDGRIIAGAMTYFGIETIAGSTSRGGSSALREMLKRLRDGGCVGITPDGRRRLLATWDRFHLALPFGRGVYLFGEPMQIGAELDDEGLETARRLLETRMVEMAGEADRLVGHEISPPVLTADTRTPARPIAGD